MRSGCDAYYCGLDNCDWMKNHDINLKNLQAGVSPGVYYFVYYSSVVGRIRGVLLAHSTNSGQVRSLYFCPL